MRAYYVGNVEKRLNKLHHGQRRRVIGHARVEAMRLGSALDLQPELFAVLPRHLDECGFKVRSRPLTPRQQLEQAFVAYYRERMEPHVMKALPDRLFVKWMRMPGTNVHDAFQHFANGWEASRVCR